MVVNTDSSLEQITMFLDDYVYEVPTLRPRNRKDHWMKALPEAKALMELQNPIAEMEFTTPPALQAAIGQKASYTTLSAFSKPTEDGKKLLISVTCIYHATDIGKNRVPLIGTNGQLDVCGTLRVKTVITGPGWRATCHYSRCF